MTGAADLSRPIDALRYLVLPQGRIGRAEFWLGFVVHAYVLHLLGLEAWVEAAVRGGLIDTGTRGLILTLLFAADMWLLSVHVTKRWHDRDLSGRLAFLFAVPVFGVFFAVFAFVVLGFLPGTPGPNRYGPPRPWTQVKADARRLGTVLAGVSIAQAAAFLRRTLAWLTTPVNTSRATPDRREPPRPPQRRPTPVVPDGSSIVVYRRKRRLFG